MILPRFTAIWQNVWNNEKAPYNNINGIQPDPPGPGPEIQLHEEAGKPEGAAGEGDSHTQPAAQGEFIGPGEGTHKPHSGAQQNPG